MSGQKLYLADALSPGASDLIYISRADGSDDGKADLIGLSGIVHGVNGGLYASQSAFSTLQGSLAAVATSGSYNDLSNLPALFSGAYADLTGKPTLGALADNDTINGGDWSGQDLAVADGGTGASSPSAARTNLGVEIGSNVQAYSANLTTYAGIAPSANVQTFLGSADFAAMRTNLSLVVGTNVQAWDADLDALAALSGTNTIYYRSAANTWTAVAIGTGLDFTTGTLTATLATIAETNTGTETAKAVTPDGLAGSNFGKRVVQIQVTDPAGSALAVADGQAYFRVPTVFNGMNLVSVSATVITASTSGLPTVQLTRMRGVATASMLSTTLTIDANETDSATAATAAVIDTANDDVATADLIRVDVTTAGTGTKGLIVTLTFQLP
jgi:hypothetical protein